MPRASRVVGTLDRRQPPLVDPRDGDIETDASSPESRSLLALAGNLLAEVSIPKFATALTLLVVVPAIVLGVAPLAAGMWFSTLSSTPRASRIGAITFLLALAVLAWLGGRKLFRLAERSFWSLNAIAIQPGYVAWREGLLHLAERVAGESASEAKRARMRAAASILAGVVIAALAVALVLFIWPSSRWTGDFRDLRAPVPLARAALVNAIVISSAYLAVAALTWGIADAAMAQPRELTTFASRDALARTWRVAHLSDVHVVGERYGFRLGSGRAGARGNERFVAALERLDDLHRREPLDAIVVTGDLTDAGTSPEWAELLDALDAFPRLRHLIVGVPGNHDMNVVDRANPARLDLPTSPKKRVRQVRTLSALAAIQGSRMRVVSDDGRIGATIDEALAPLASDLAEFAQRGKRRLAKQADVAWEALFPMVLPPDRPDGLGIVALNSNAETHFSFTNALGLVSMQQADAVEAAMSEYPRACWIVALHHHIVECPKLGHALAERVGTTLINGNWFARRLHPYADRAIVMHGHRHIDWIGECGTLQIVSAPSAVLEAPGRDDVYFYVHTIGVDGTGRARLAAPARVTVSG